MKNIILSFAVIALSQSAFAFDYKCNYAQGDDENVDTTTMTINANEVKVTQTQQGGGDPNVVTGKRNRSYSPRTGDEGAGELLAEKQLLKGAEEGRIKIRFHGESFDNTMYRRTRQ